VRRGAKKQDKRSQIESAQFHSLNRFKIQRPKPEGRR
jgi:hypothetical protein